MTKLSLADIDNITGAESTAIATINNNNDAIVSEIDNTLSRDGSSPNTMGADLDMNSNDILNAASIETSILVLNGTPLATELFAIGPTGPAGTLAVGTVSTLTPGSSATVVNVGTSTAAILNFGLPQGSAGAGTGDMLKSSNLSDVASASTAFTNIKQVGTTSATGVLQIASNAEVLAGTDTAHAIVSSALQSRVATAAQYRANTTGYLLTTDKVWSAMAEVTLTDAATVAVDMSSGFDFVVTLAGNRTLGAPTNTKVGQRGRIRVVQDATGSRTLALASAYKTAGATGITLSTPAASVDYLDYDVVSSSNIRVSLSKAWA